MFKVMWQLLAPNVCPLLIFCGLFLLSDLVLSFLVSLLAHLPSPRPLCGISKTIYQTFWESSLLGCPVANLTQPVQDRIYNFCPSPHCLYPTFFTSLNVNTISWGAHVKNFGAQVLIILTSRNIFRLASPLYSSATSCI